MPKLNEKLGKVKRNADLSFDEKITRKNTCKLAKYLLRISHGMRA
jgi:hypothetical protein